MCVYCWKRLFFTFVHNSTTTYSVNQISDAVSRKLDYLLFGLWKRAKWVNTNENCMQLTCAQHKMINLSVIYCAHTAHSSIRDVIRRENSKKIYHIYWFKFSSNPKCTGKVYVNIEIAKINCNAIRSCESNGRTTFPVHGVTQKKLIINFYFLGFVREIDCIGFHFVDVHFRF